MIDKNQISVPSWLTRDLVGEAKEHKEAQYRSALPLLKDIKTHFKHLLEASVKRSEELLTMDQYIYEGSYRKALRELLRAF